MRTARVPYPNERLAAQRWQGLLDEQFQRLRIPKKKVNATVCPCAHSKSRVGVNVDSPMPRSSSFTHDQLIGCDFRARKSFFLVRKRIAGFLSAKEGQPAPGYSLL